MAQERVRFPGDPEVKETGTGQGPSIPLDTRVRPTSVEMLNDGDGGDGDEEGGPAYSRERIGARVGLPLEETQSVATVEDQLDTEDVVPLLFQKALKVQDQGLMHSFGAGVHLVPVSLAGRDPKGKDMHWWLKANKVRRTGKAMPRPQPEPAEQD